MRMLIADARLAMDAALVPGSLLVEDGRIAELLGPGARAAAVERVDARGMILAPGFIDLHCHGGAGADVNDGTDDALATLRAHHRSRGTTSFTPSLSVDPLPVLEAAFDAVRRAAAAEAPGEAEILGAHFESPYISLKYKGCQAAERLLPFDREARALIERNADAIGRITVAPELPGVLEAIPRLRELGMAVSLGHSDADAETFAAAVDRGATMVTHLFNAMSSVRKEGPFRVPGVLEAALTDDRVFAEVIADGKHVPARLMEIAWRCKGRDRFMVCSDANRGAGMAPGRTLYTCGQEAVVVDGVAMLKDRSSLASSVSSLDDMVRVLVRQLGLPIHEALRAASAVPAAAIGVADRKGRLAAGCDADLVLLDDGLQVARVWCRGVEAGRRA